MCKKADLYFIALGKDPFRSGNFMSTMRPHFDEKDLVKETLIGVLAWYDYEHLALFEAPCIIIGISVHSLILSLAWLLSSSLDQNLSLMKGCD